MGSAKALDEVTGEIVDAACHLHTGETVTVTYLGGKVCVINVRSW